MMPISRRIVIKPQRADMLRRMPVMRDAKAYLAACLAAADISGGAENSDCRRVPATSYHNAHFHEDFRSLILFIASLHSI